MSNWDTPPAQNTRFKRSSGLKMADHQRKHQWGSDASIDKSFIIDKWLKTSEKLGKQMMVAGFLDNTAQEMSDKEIIFNLSKGKRKDNRSVKYLASPMCKQQFCSIKAQKVEEAVSQEIMLQQKKDKIKGKIQPNMEVHDSTDYESGAESIVSNGTGPCVVCQSSVSAKCKKKPRLNKPNLLVRLDQ